MNAAVKYQQNAELILQWLDTCEHSPRERALYRRSLNSSIAIPDSFTGSCQLFFLENFFSVVASNSAEILSQFSPTTRQVHRALHHRCIMMLMIPYVTVVPK